MSRIINPESAGKERNQLIKAIVISLRELMKQPDVSQDTRDLAAFISRGLLAVHATIEHSVAPWEKRGYWVKADKFRMEWAWTKDIGDVMVKAVLDEDWAAVAGYAATVGQKLKKVEVSERHRMGKPWVGAWTMLKEESQ